MSSPTYTPPHLKAKTRIASIQVCRGLAALLVVIAHLHNLELKYFHSNHLGLFQFGVAGVDLFFVISGVVIAAVTEGQLASMRNATRFLYQRCARIYPIYWIYTLLVLAVYLYNPQWVNAEGGHHVHIASSFLLIPTEIPMLLLQGWTLSYELYFYAVFFLLLLLCPERWRLPMLLVWASLVTAAHFLARPGQPLLALLCSPLVYEFFFGCVLFTLYRRASLHPAIGAAFVVTACGWFLVLVRWTAQAHHGDQQWIEYSSLLRPLLYGSLAAVFLFGMMEMERSKVISFMSPLVAVGDWSYSTYLSHTIVLKVVCLVFLKYLPKVSVGWVALVSMPVVLAVSYASFTFLERPLMALLYKPSRQPVKTLPHARGDGISVPDGC